MPNWKKIALSGSSPEFLSLNVDTSISAGSITGSIDFSNLTNTPTLISSSAQITGDLNITSVTGSFSGSFYGTYQGDGSGLTGIQAQIVESATVSDTFISQSSINVSHTFNTKDVIVSVYDFNDKQVIPASVITATTSSVSIEFDNSTSGRVIVAKGGHIVSGSISVSIVSSSTVSDTFTSVTSHTVNHTFGTKDVFVNVFNSADDIIIPARINTPTTSSVVVYFDTDTTGRVVIGKAGHIVSGSAEANVDFSAVGEHIIPTTADTYDLGSILKPWRDLYLSSASLYIDGQKVLSSNADVLTLTTDVGQSIKLLETGADDIILQTDTGNIELKGTVEILSGKKIIDSAGNKISFGDTLEITGSINLSGTVDGVDVATLKSDFDTLEGKTLVSGSSQVSFEGITGIPTLVSGSSQIDYTSLQNIPTGIVSSSSQIDTLGYLKVTGDNVVSGSDQLSGSLVTLDSTQTITGQKTFQDIVVIGTGSFAYITSVTGSAKTIGDNYLILNADSPTQRYSGLKVFDSGSSDTGSLEYDSVNNHWFYESTTEGYASGLISGPRDTRGAITWPSNNKIVKGIGGNHIDDSNITDTGTLITLGSNTEITGTLVATGTSLVSSSAQILFTGIADKPTLVSGSSQIDYNSIQNKPTIPTNNNQLTNGAGYTTFTANQSVDTTSTVTFSTVTATTLTETSALRFKENIQEDIDSSIIDKLRPVSYDWKENKTKDYGFIAEEVDELDTTLTTKEDGGQLLGIKYTKLIPLLVKKIQEQEERIKQLENGNS
jgi:hypothetical protein